MALIYKGKKMKIKSAVASVKNNTGQERCHINLSFRIPNVNKFFDIQFLLTLRHREYNKKVINQAWPHYAEPSVRAMNSRRPCFIGQGYVKHKFIPGKSQPHQIYENTCALAEYDIKTNQYQFECWIEDCHLAFTLYPREVKMFSHKGEYRSDEEDTLPIVKGEWI